MNKLNTNQKRRLARAISRAASAELAARQAQLRLIRAERRVVAEEFEALRRIAIIISLPFLFLLCAIFSSFWFILIAEAIVKSAR
jgi:choline-glycine betaine transporter